MLFTTNLFKNISIAIVLLLMSFGAANAQYSGFGGGNGTQSNPYIISTKTHWDYFSNWVNGKNGTPCAYAGCYIKLNANITGVTEPVGGRAGSGRVNTWCGFNGNFNGNGFIVTVNMSNTSWNDVGVFGVLAGNAVVQNLIVNGTIKGHACLGGIAGVVAPTSEVRIHACTNNASIIYSGYVDGEEGYRGGIVGAIFGQGVKIECCVNNGGIAGNWSVGGIVGRMDTYTTVSRCINTVSITGAGCYIGGIAGEATGNWNIEHCLNGGTSVANAVSGTDCIGGIIGKDWNNGSGSGRIASCVSTNIVTPSASGASRIYVGNIIGRPGSNISIAACFYDAAKSDIYKGIGANNTNPVNSIDYISSTKVTFGINPSTSMYGNSLLNQGLSSGYWNQMSGYPQPKVCACNATFWNKVSVDEIEETEAVCSHNHTFNVSEVYPMIVNDNAILDVHAEEAGHLKIAIYDMAGSKIMDVAEQYVNADTDIQISINELSFLARGTYSVMISIGKDMAVRKFIKQ